MKDTTQQIIIGGDCYFDFFDEDDNLTGLISAGNVKSLIPKVETETMTTLLNGRDTLGQTGESYTRITGSTVSFTLSSYTPEFIAAFFAGESVTNVSDGGATSGAATAILGAGVEIDLVGATDLVVKDSTETTTYELDTDYTYNSRLGMLTAVSGGSITDGEELHWSGTAPATTGKKITGATRPVRKVRILVDGSNYVNSEDVVIKIWEATIKSNNDFDLMSEEFPELEFSGEMLTPSGKSWPFELV